MLLCTPTHEEIHQLFAMVQMIRIETLEWIAEAKRQFTILRRAHGWHWIADKRVDSDQFPALEGQLLLSGTTLDSSNSNAWILHPCLSTQSQPSVTNIPGPPLPSLGHWTILL